VKIEKINCFDQSRIIYVAIIDANSNWIINITKSNRKGVERSCPNHIHSLDQDKTKRKKIDEWSSDDRSFCA
jgi:hypothetical protein